MKFAYLKSYTVQGLELSGKSQQWGHVNLGDPIRDYTLSLLYKKMNVCPVNLYFDDFTTYTGETVVLPINTYLNYPYGYGQLPMSNKIIPVYLHLAIHDMELFRPEFFQSYQPIGCRDEQTMRVLHSMGIQTYLSGCLSLTYPRSAKVPKNGKVFFVDTPETLLNFVPDEIKKRAEFLSHEVFVTADNQADLDIEIEKIMLERLKGTSGNPFYKTKKDDKIQT
jgi:hypothetical protein